MILRVYIFMLLVTFIATAGCGSGAENDLGQGLFIDGPGGYLPDGGYIAGDTNANIAFDFDSSRVFDREPTVNLDKFMPLLIEIDYDNIWDILSCRDSLFDARSFSFYL